MKKALQILAIDELYLETQTPIDRTNYVLIGCQNDELDGNSVLRKDCDSKQEAVNSPDVLIVKSQQKTAKFKKNAIRLAADLFHLYDPQNNWNNTPKDDASYIVFWTVNQEK